MAGMRLSDVVAPSVETVQEGLAETIAVKQQMQSGEFARQTVEVARVIISALRAGGKVIFFGNGGSAQEAGHLATELMGRFAFDRPGLAAISLPDATAAITAIGNDYSYDEVFARQALAAGPATWWLVGPDHVGQLRQRRARARSGRPCRNDDRDADRRPRRQGADVAQICIRVPSPRTPAGSRRPACIWATRFAKWSNPHCFQTVLTMRLRNVATVFLDRDGTLNAKVADGQCIRSPAELVLLPGAARALAALNAAKTRRRAGARAVVR